DTEVSRRPVVHVEVDDEHLPPRLNQGAGDVDGVRRLPYPALLVPDRDDPFSSFLVHHPSRIFAGAPSAVNHLLTCYRHIGKRRSSVLVPITAGRQIKMFRRYRRDEVTHSGFPAPIGTTAPKNLIPPISHGSEVGCSADAVIGIFRVADIGMKAPQSFPTVVPYH